MNLIAHIRGTRLNQGIFGGWVRASVDGWLDDWLAGWLVRSVGR